MVRSHVFSSCAAFAFLGIAFVVACGSSDSGGGGASSGGASSSGEPPITCDSGCIDGSVVTGPPGELDPSFAKGGVAAVPGSRGGSYTYFAGLMRAPDGSLFVASYAGDDSAVAHLLPDGSIDRAYGKEGLASVPGRPAIMNNRMAVAVDAANRVVVVQRPAEGDGDAYVLVRLAADGSPDGSFGSAGIAGPFVDAASFNPMFVVPRSDGKVMIAGDYGSSGVKFGFALHGADGARDQAFATVKTDDDAPELPMDLVALADGSLVTCAPGVLRKYDGNGTRDGAFGSGGVARLPIPDDAGQPPDGVLALAAPEPGFLVGYSQVSGEQVFVGTVTVADDGKLGASPMARVDPKASGSPSVHAIARADDRIAVGGFEQTGTGSGHVWLAELQSDATFHAAFAAGVAGEKGFTKSGAYEVKAMLREAGSGKLLVGGVTGSGIFVARVFQ